ncbi:MAG: outer membrane lipoprotein carrier protein LolA [Legionellales bacterium]|nr:outer membrane lipoprotein carrier protein LolA [Legionellales bacterium]|tara:strand:+ start:5775 stop:6398 length:624 start_codon:yes stop_codon:yes gene_type:complete
MLRRYFWLLLLLPQLAWADQASSDALTKLLADFNGMTANFQQVISDPNGGALQKASGKMALVRPGKFRWQTLKPNKQLIVTNDEQMWIYDEDLEQATVEKLQLGSGTPATLLSGDLTQLDKDFTITRVKSDDKGQWFQLTPKADESVFQWVKLGFVNGTVSGMVLLDNIGQQTDVDFTNVKLNPTIPSKQFQFTPPAGVDVVGQTTE